MAKIAANLSAYEARARRLKAEKDQSLKDVSSQEEKFKECQERMQTQRGAVSDIYNRKEGACAGFQKLKDSLIELDEKIGLDERLSAALDSKAEILRELIDNKEGLGEGVKFYLDAMEQDSELRSATCGVLTDLIKVNAGYEAAFEAALNGRLTSLILKRKETALAVIEKIKGLSSEKTRNGRIAFILSDAFNSHKISREACLKPENSSWLKEFVAAPDECDNMIKGLIGDVLVVDSLKEAVNIASDERFSELKMVTKNGAFITDKTVVYNISEEAEYTGVIGRKERLEKVLHDIESTKLRVSLLKEQRCQTAEDLRQQQEMLDTIEKEARKEELKLAAEESVKNKIESELKKLKEELELVELELDEVNQEKEQLAQEQAASKEEFQRLESDHRQLQERIAEKQTIIEESKSEREELIIAATQIETELSLVSEKFNSSNETLAMLHDSLAKEKDNIQSRIQQIEFGEERVKNLRDEIERLTKENEILAEEKQKTSSELSDYEGKKYELTASLQDLEEQMSAKQKQADEIRGQMSNLRVNMTGLEYKASSIKEKVQNIYKEDLDNAQIVFDGTEDFEGMRAEVESLRDRLDRIGPVNLVAIEEHEELLERFEFLTSQQQDLLDAKESLHKAINKINRTTRQMFLETFEQIKVCFKDYFRMLFGGGRADIYLVDQADILESGIEIIVQPPGKKLQSISLLSGGEKALTSVAILFSLLKVRPSPFCILDEMDAPLDEANIDRFTRLLRDFVSSTQFIIITHSKKTIAISDVMYGITMEKSGISKIVSVRFANDETSKDKVKGKAEPVLIGK